MEGLVNRIKYRYYKVVAVVLAQYGPVQYRTSIMTWGDHVDNDRRLTTVDLSKDRVGMMRRFVYDYSGPRIDAGTLMGSDGLRDREQIQKAREAAEAWFTKKAKRFEHKLEENIVWVQISLIPMLYPSENGSWNWFSADSRFGPE